MDPVQNPFAPGAGSRPPELAGRDPIIERATVALQRIRLGRHSKSQLLLGLRGVGKTVLLSHIAEKAEDEGYLTVFIEAFDGRRLADLLTPELRALLYKVSRVEKARAIANRATAALRSFASAFKISYGDFEVGVEAEPDDVATGELEADLPTLLLVVAKAAEAAERPVAIFIDEMQFLKPPELGALIGALHRVGQRNLPLVLFGAGLPQLAGLAGDAKSYAERLFEFPPIGPLSLEATTQAVREPVEAAGAAIDDDALRIIYERTNGYPYFLQEWAHHSWDLAPESPIRGSDAERASLKATSDLDASFFRVRFDRLTSREQDYLRAMAEMGPGPHRSGEIAGRLAIDVTTTGSLRTGLIRKGMLYAPSHGETAFTVPMFDEFMRRAIPNWQVPVPVKKPKKKKKGRD